VQPLVDMIECTGKLINLLKGSTPYLGMQVSSFGYPAEAVLDK